MPHPRSLAGPFVALALLALPAAALAQAQVPFSGIGADRSAPVELSADALEVDQAAGTARFSGNVLVVQGDLRLAAETVRVEYAAAPDTGRNRIARIHAEGGVTLVTPDEAAEAARAVYDLDDGAIVMEGEVLLTQGGNALAGERLVIDLERGTGRIEGRVRSVILPGSGP
jgi:lipopolysaccharide export system protein LptA